MKVFKFGGASVNSVERIQNLAAIMRHFTGEKIVVIVSAMGKTTNALEKVVEAFFAGNKDEALGFLNRSNNNISLLPNICSSQTTLHANSI